MAFFQTPPALENPFTNDPLLASYLERKLGPDDGLSAELTSLGELAIEYYHRSLADRENEPTLTQWDPWGNRIDQIEVSPLWRDAAKLSATHGLVAAGYDDRFGDAARIHQFAIVSVLAPSLDLYSCPLAMTDGAARTLLGSEHAELKQRVVPHLLSRDPAQMWTSGQWMTERTGGSDVSGTETVARLVDGQWRLWGTKWFTSATTSQLALTLARPEGNPDGSRGLALFAVETRDEAGRLRNILVNRLKDKLGTRKVPTAELTLEGTPAVLVGSQTDGVRAITPMLAITRTWNAISAYGLMRRAVDLARNYATKRKAFGDALIAKPLHVDTLAGLEAECAAAFVLSFRMAELLGKTERASATEDELALSRVLTPIGKLGTGKQAVAVCQEAMECCGGAGYVEDTGLPRIFADANVLPIWEGTTNVLALDTLRALGKAGTSEAVLAEFARVTNSCGSEPVRTLATRAQAAATDALRWAATTMTSPAALEGGARRFTLTLSRAFALCYLCEHADWLVTRGHKQASYALAAATRFANNGVSSLGGDRDFSAVGSAALLQR